MTQVEKAKAYDNVVNKLMRFMEHGIDPLITRADVQDFFPELKESEDERIRKWLIFGMNALKEQKNETFATIPIDDVIAWLEKQDKQKHIFNADDWYVSTVDGKIHYIYHSDKVEQKFHEGDWVVYNNDICQIVKREEGCNKLVTVFGIEKEPVNERNLSTAHLWTIKDAKDGDVLVCQLPRGYEAGEQIFIFQGINSRDYEENCIEYYCRICEGVFYENKNGYMGTTSSPIYPASKTQCDLLFVKMHEAGFEWNAEKKELRKIDQSELTEFEDAVKDMMNAYRDAIGANDVTTEEIKKHAKYLLSLIPHKPIEQKLSNSENIGKNEKPMWTDEDEKRLQSCIITLQGKGLMGGVDTIDTKWLKSLKQKMEEQ